MPRSLGSSVFRLPLKPDLPARKKFSTRQNIPIQCNPTTFGFLFARWSALERYLQIGGSGATWSSMVSLIDYGLELPEGIWIVPGIMV
jgi:hypothetical protein